MIFIVVAMAITNYCCCYVSGYDDSEQAFEIAPFIRILPCFLFSTTTTTTTTPSLPRWIPCIIVQHTLHSLALRESLLQYVYFYISDDFELTCSISSRDTTRWHSAVRVFHVRFHCIDFVLNAFIHSFGSCIRYFQGRYWYRWYWSFQT